MTVPGSYNASQTHRDLDTEIERLRAQALMGWEKEARTLSLFGLSDGMSVLELGSGPGFVTEQLLELVPGGSVTCVEIDPVLIGRAKGYLTGKEEGRWRIVEASVMETGLPDNNFDFAVARLIFQHLPDPLGAAKEVFRVLKPGGKLVIIYVDDEMDVYEPRLPELELLLEKFAQVQAARGGNRYIGRRLPRILRDAGFGTLDVEVALLHTDVVGMEAFLPQLDPGRLAPMVQAGLISDQELEGLIAARERFLASDPIIVSLLMMACGQKP